MYDGMPCCVKQWLQPWHDWCRVVFLCPHCSVTCLPGSQVHQQSNPSSPLTDERCGEFRSSSFFLSAVMYGSTFTDTMHSHP